MDRYTKVILTVIAISLTIQTAKDISVISNAKATIHVQKSKKIQKVAICREDGLVCAGVGAFQEGFGGGMLLSGE